MDAYLTIPPIIDTALFFYFALFHVMCVSSAAPTGTAATISLSNMLLLFRFSMSMEIFTHSMSGTRAPASASLGESGLASSALAILVSFWGQIHWKKLFKNTYSTGICDLCASETTRQGKVDFFACFATTHWQCCQISLIPSTLKAEISQRCAYSVVWLTFGWACW